MTAKERQRLCVWRWLSLGMQAAFATGILLPVGVQNNGTSLNSLQLAAVYSENNGHPLQGGLFVFLYLAFPVLSWIFLLLLRGKPRLDCAVPVFFCAGEALATACLYTACDHALGGLVHLHAWMYLIPLYALVNMGACIVTYLLSWDREKWEQARRA